MELVIVGVIIAVLATVGIQQYSRAIEQSRGAEAKQILGQIRTSAAGFYLTNGNALTSSFDNNAAGIGPEADRIPSACRTTHYFSYAVIALSGDTVAITATRCTASGKAPNAAVQAAAITLILTTNLTTGADTWGGTGGY